MAKEVQTVEVAAGIVTYNPEIKRLKKNIDAISVQVKYVYCFDNGSANIKIIKELVQQYDNVILIENGKNSGIAEGMNQIIRKVRGKHIAWLLTMDQDSVCPPKMISTMLRYASKEDIAAICPAIFDRRRPQKKILKPIPTTEFTDFCITSGCLVNTEKSKQIGDFDSWLFIGQVDDEFCHRIVINGMKILRVNTIQLDHELGELRASKYQKLFLQLGKIFRSPKLTALSYKRKVSPMRVYYSTRNIVYLSRKYSKYPNPKFTKKRAIYNAISNILRGQEKLKITKAVIRGYRDGGKAKVSVYRKNK